MDERDRRTKRRQFIWENHPDRGGDPAEFIAGLQHFRPRSPASSPVTFYRRPRGIARLRPLASRIARTITRTHIQRRVH